MSSNGDITASEDQIAKTFRKATWRLIPFLGLLYLVSFLDRVNIGFAALTMNSDLGLSAAAFGTGAGIFFLGYFLFEVPSNLILERTGARRWISRIMLSWGVLSMAMAFVQGANSFWFVRFFLGAAEAGFFPGIILYLTHWFPTPLRGRIMGWFLLALPISSVIGAPFSTWLLETSLFGMKGWQSMFILEGIPAVVLGIAVLRYLPDSPRRARWLTAEEAAIIEAALAADEPTGAHSSFRKALSTPAIWVFALLYLLIVLGLYGFGFWVPQMVKAFGDISVRQVGLLVAVPYALAAVAMVVWAWNSDRTGERHKHVAFAALLGAAGFAMSALVDQPVLKMLAFSCAAIGVYAALPVFWTLPSRMLKGAAAAGGIALINAVGNIGGYVGPAAIGQLKDAYGFAAGLLILSAALVAAAGLAFLIGKRAAMPIET